MLQTPQRLLPFALCLLMGLMGCKSSQSQNKPAQVQIDAMAAAPTETNQAVPAPKPEVPPEKKGPQIKKPFFYKVEGPDGSAGYLLGTMHMGIDVEKELPASVWAIIAEAKVLVLEADVTDPSLAMAMMLPKDTNLRAVVGEKTWKLLVEALGESIAHLLMPMKPAAAASFLALRDLPKTMPMDLTLLSYATREKKELQYLETGEFQINLLNKIMTVEFLDQMLKNPEAMDSSKLLEVYRVGDQAQLQQLLLDPKAWGGEEKSAANLKAMLFDRNADWLPKLKTLFRTPNVFVAVGAAHLVGDKSVIDLLQSDGYTVTRISP